jgi:FkbH-like protein
LLSYIKKQSSYGAQIIIVSKNESTSIQSALSFIDPFWDRWVTSIDAGWNAKHLRIQSLVHKMNININDCVFIDDNPIEIQSVKDELRMRNAIQYNGIFSSLMQELNILGLLNAGKGNFINERKNQYRNLLEDKNQKRDKSLNVDYSYELWHNNKDHYDRVMELSSKTNQFNLNKELLTKDSFRKYSLYTWDCRTKFGYLGVIGYAIISSKSELINFVMSCRALGFSLEQEVFNRLLKNINIRSVLFNKTEKNGVAETFINELERSHELKIISKPAIQKID